MNEQNKRVGKYFACGPAKDTLSSIGFMAHFADLFRSFQLPRVNDAFLHESGRERERDMYMAEKFQKNIYIRTFERTK